MEPIEIQNTIVSAPSIAQPTVMQAIEEPIKTDGDIWTEILADILDGVLFHMACVKAFSAHDLCGYAAMHSAHAKEEFSKYLHVLNDFIQEWNYIPAERHNTHTINITTTEFKDMMNEGMEIYEKWENETCKKLNNAKEQIHGDTKEHVCYLIEAVKEERKAIRRMWDDLDNNKAVELDEWLQKNYGEH